MADKDMNPSIMKTCAHANAHILRAKEFSVSVVIPNYNGRHLLQAYLPSVFEALNAAVVNYEVIVVDDFSTDDSVVFVQSNYPDIKLLVNEVNKGFSATINRGIFVARQKLVLALNSDVKLTVDYFSEQFKYFESDDTFGVMGRITDMDGLHIQDGAKFPKVSYKGIKTTYNYFLNNYNDDLKLPSFFLSGANALMDREKLHQLGGFDVLYSPFYYEDADLGIRAWRVGWKCYFEPKAICMHAVSSTISKLKSEKVKIIIERNRITFNYLHLEGLQLSGFKIWLAIRCFSRLLKGNTIIYKALQEVNPNRLALEKSKQALLKLQAKNNVSYTVNWVEQKITKEIKSLSYRIF